MNLSDLYETFRDHAWGAIGQRRRRMNLSDLYETLVSSVFCLTCSKGSGTGFLVRADGLILTNRHVVGLDHEIQLQGNRGPSFLGKVIYADRRRDIAAVRIEQGTIPHAAKPLKIGDSHDVRIGEEIYAIGHPAESAAFSLTKGIVSAVTDMNEQNLPFLQANISINFGNSGGPLFSANGTVVGMVREFRNVNGERIEGLCWAIPAEAIVSFIAKIPSLDGDISHLHYCSVCGSLAARAKYCLNCGIPVEPQEKPSANESSIHPSKPRSKKTVCPTCKASNHTDVRYCHQCGVDLWADHDE